MTQNEQTIARFFKAFQQKDPIAMQACLAADIAYSNPVSGLLRGKAVWDMWEVECRTLQSFSLQFRESRTTDQEYYTCEWAASFIHPATKRRVVNNCKAFMRLDNGIITEHSDAFKYYRWVRQVYGLPGLVFGWSGLMHKWVNARYRKYLERSKRELMIA